MNTNPITLANDLLEKYGQGRPIDVEKIANEIGLKIEYLDLEANVSGFLLVRDDDTIIGVNKSHHPHRQRFTIAHELGHYLIHRDEINFASISNYYTDKGLVFFRNEKSSEGTDNAEQQANKFAANLLMPKKDLQKKIQHKIKATDDLAIKKLATDFAVSQVAMSFRLTNLHLVESLF